MEAKVLDSHMADYRSCPKASSLKYTPGSVYACSKSRKENREEILMWSPGRISGRYMCVSKILVDGEMEEKRLWHDHAFWRRRVLSPSLFFCLSVCLRHAHVPSDLHMYLLTCTHTLWHINKNKTKKLAIEFPLGL